jgi:hypothetical protein
MDVIDENIEPFQYRDANIAGINGFAPPSIAPIKLINIYRQKVLRQLWGVSKSP